MKTCLSCLAWLFTAMALFVVGAHSEELRPLQAHAVALGDVLGVVYYSPESNGFRVVVTLGEADATPVCFIATLAPEQSAVIAVPRGPGQMDAVVTVERHGDRLMVSDTSVAAP